MGENGVSHFHDPVNNSQMELTGVRDNIQHSETGGGSSSKRSRTYSTESTHRQVSAQPSSEMLSVTQSSRKKQSKSEIIDRKVLACHLNFNWIIFYFVK